MDMANSLLTTQCLQKLQTWHELVCTDLFWGF